MAGSLRAAFAADLQARKTRCKALARPVAPARTRDGVPGPGPLDVHADDGVVKLPGPEPRAVLAMLLLSASQRVSPERLAVACGRGGRRRRGQDGPGSPFPAVEGARRPPADHPDRRRLPAERRSG